MKIILIVFVFFLGVEFFWKAETDTTFFSNGADSFSDIPKTRRNIK